MITHFMQSSDQGDVFESLREKLVRRGVAHLEGLIVRSIDDYMDERPLRIAALAEAEPLPDSEAALLSEVGIDTDVGHATMAPMVAMAMGRSELLSNSLSTEEAAKLLGVNSSRLRQRISEGSLLAIKDGRAWRIPVFQFENGVELPNWSGVMRSIRNDVNPVVVWRFLNTLQVDLVDSEGNAQTPLDWLRAGQDVEPLNNLARDL